MTSYEQGFMNKCAEYGVDGRALLEKLAGPIGPDGKEIPVIDTESARQLGMNVPQPAPASQATSAPITHASPFNGLGRVFGGGQRKMPLYQGKTPSLGPGASGTKYIPKDKEVYSNGDSREISFGPHAPTMTWGDFKRKANLSMGTRPHDYFSDAYKRWQQRRPVPRSFYSN